ncbi:MAG: acetyl-CoA carboxylase biotin carboxyl carrier protein [Acidobacteriaceae bacterium]
MDRAVNVTAKKSATDKKRLGKKRLGSMNPEEIAELKELIEFLKENGIGEFDLERGDLKVRLKFASAGQPADLSQIAHLAAAAQAAQSAASFQPTAVAHAHPAHASAAPPAAESGIAAAPVDDEAGLHIVKSPIVGTFYESPSPGSPAFVKPGDTVEVGQVLCIVEAMKLMNEIESDAAGEIVKRFVTTGQPVEYGQKLFAVRPR